MNKIYKRAKNTGVSPYTLVKRKIGFSRTKNKTENCGECQHRREFNYSPENLEREGFYYECEQCGEDYGTEYNGCPYCGWPIGKVLRCEVIGVIIKPEARVTISNVCACFSKLEPEIKPDGDDQPELVLN